MYLAAEETGASGMLVRAGGVFLFVLYQRRSARSES
jgi:hypothetical protein